MRRFFFLHLVLCLLLGLWSCSQESSIQFENPQPLAGKNEASLPAKLLGQYLHIQDSSTLMVTPSAIVRVGRIVGNLSLAELAQDTVTYNLEKGRFYTADFPEGLLVQRQTVDSLFLHVPFVDTLFAQNAGHHLRQLSDLYLFNKEITPGRWQVFCLQPKGKNGLQLLFLHDSLDRPPLHNLHPLKEIDGQYVANPTRKEFRKFIHQGGFRRREQYQRIPDSVAVPVRSGGEL